SQIADMNGLPLERRSTADESPIQRACLPELENRTEGTILRDQAEVLALDLVNQRVVGLAEPRGGPRGGVEHGLAPPGLAARPRSLHAAAHRPLHRPEPSGGSGTASTAAGTA